MKVVFLASAEQDLLDLRQYVIQHFSPTTWDTTLRRLKESVRKLKTHPRSGSVPEELRLVGPSQFRQVITGMNRLIYELRDGTVYIHVVCDARRDFRTLLMRRVMRES